jgi:hypothetical protein
MVNESQLAALNARLDQCTVCTTVSRQYRHVPGGGWTTQPTLMLVFINPTVRNITAHAAWDGVRFPFAGKPKLWGILATAGLVGADLPERIAALGHTPEMVELLVDETRHHRLYLTNAVKCVDNGSNLPGSERIHAAWAFLQAEIALVQPRYIVAFGLIPFRVLTGSTVRLSDHLWDAQHGRCTFFSSHPIAGRTYPVFPCYFPTGRGNPVAATKMLIALRQHLQAELATDLARGADA